MSKYSLCQNYSALITISVIRTCALSLVISNDFTASVKVYVTVVPLTDLVAPVISLEMLYFEAVQVNTIFLNATSHSIFKEELA